MRMRLVCGLLMLGACAATEPVQSRPPGEPIALDAGVPARDAGPAAEWCSATGRPTNGGQPGDFLCVAPSSCGRDLSSHSTCCPPQDHECIPGTFELCTPGGVADSPAQARPLFQVCVSPEICGATHSIWRCCQSPDRFCR